MEECIRLQRGAQRCVEVHRGVCRGVGRCMEGYVDLQRYMDRCAVVHGGVLRCRGMCRGVWETEVCRGAQKVMEVHRCMWRCLEGSRRYMEGFMEVQGGGQRGVWRWTESVLRYAEDCIEAYRGM